MERPVPMIGDTFSNPSATRTVEIRHGLQRDGTVLAVYRRLSPVSGTWRITSRRWVDYARLRRRYPNVVL